MLVEETLDLLLIDVAHLLWRDSNLIPVLVVTRFRQLIDLSLRVDLVVQYAKLGKICGIYRTAGVVGLALVALVQE